MSEKKGGAPSGGRVHWLVYELSREAKLHYSVNFDYEYHNYFIFRQNRRGLIDCFAVIRTSKNLFRCMYYNARDNYFEYFSGSTPKETAAQINKKISRNLLVERMRYIEEEEKDE